jgi:hypothetical protein
MSDPVGDLKHELLSAAERRLAPAPPRARRLRKRMLLAAAALPIAAAVALFFTAPWRSSPGFLERAQAALAPQESSVLHLRWRETHISKDLGCTVTLDPQELWADQAPPHRYRVIWWQAPPPEAQSADSRANACNHNGGAIEIGGVGTQSTPLVFEAPNTLRTAHEVSYGFTPDPVARLREAIADGSAHDEGTTELDGRTVRRIRIDHRCRDAEPCADYAYVDPETFAFVREEWPAGFGFAPGPSPETFYFDVVLDYLAFEYLPRTEANLALTDIRAQHPDATGP